MPVNMCRKMIRWREDGNGKGQKRKSVSLLEKKGQLIGEGDLNVGEGESKDTLVYIGWC